MALPKIKTDNLQPYVLSLITICLLSFLVMGYFLVYVPNHEQIIVKRNYRSLQSMAANIDIWKDTYDKFNETFFRNFPNPESVCIDSIGENHPDNDLYYFPNKESWKLEYYSCKKYTTAHKPVNFSFQNANGKTYILFSRMYNNEDFDGKGSQTRYEFKSRATLNYFLKDKLDTTYFESFFILDNDSVIFSNANFTIEKGSTDSLLFSNGGIKSSAVRDFKIENSDYKIFSFPIKIASDHYSTLCATVNTKKFNEERFSLPGNTIIVVCGVLVVVLLSISLIKLVLINKYEPLNTFDVISAFLSFALLMSFLTMFVFDYYSLITAHKQAEARHLKYLSKTIGANLKQEFKSCLEQLQVYDSVVKDTHYDYRLDRNYPHDIAYYKIDKSDIPFWPDTSNMKLNFALHVNNKLYKHANRIFWMDSKGKEMRNFINNNEVYPKKNNKARPYFNRIINGSYYTLDGKNFMFEPLNSGVTGDFATVVSMPSSVEFYDDTVSKKEKASVIAMSADFVSAVNPIIPIPYQFCVVDATGKVYYHSDRSRNLIENFVEECENNGHLKSALYAKTSTFLTADYKGKNYRMYCKPIEGLPLYVISFVDLKLFATINLETFSYASLLNFLMFFLVGTAMFIVFLFSIRSSKLHKPFIDLKWLWFDQRMTPVYILNIISNGVIFIVLICIMVFPSESSGKIWYFMASSVFSVFQFFITSKLHKRKLKVQKEGFKKVEWQKGGLFAIISGFMFTILLVIGNSFLSCGYIYMILFYIFLAGLSAYQIAVVGTFEKFHHIPKFLKDKYNPKESLNKYCLVLLTWIFMCCMLPSVLFYELSLKREIEIFTKNMQLNLALELTAKSQKVENDSSIIRYNIPKKFKRGSSETPNIYTNGIYNTHITTTDPAIKSDFVKDEPYRSFARSLRIPFSESNQLSNELFNVSANSSKYQDWKMNHTQLVLHYVPIQKNIHSKLNDIYIYSDLYSMRTLFTKNMHGMLMLCILIIIFGLISLFVYKIIYFFTNRIFGLDFSLFRKQDPDAPAEMLNRFFYVHNPSSLNIDYTDLKNTKNQTVVLLDCVAISNANKWFIDTQAILSNKDINSLTIRILNFDFDYTNQRSQLLKLNFIEQLTSYDCRIEIYSTIDPWWYDKKEILPADSDEKMNIKIERDGINPDTGLDGKHTITIDRPVFPKSGIRKRWIQVFRTFALISVPVKTKANYSNYSSKKLTLENEFVKKFINHECAYDKMLVGLKTLLNEMNLEGIENSNDSLADTHEELILQIQKMARFHYYSIWENLSNEERLIVYDLAENDLTNVQNGFVVRSLINKGIVVFENQLDLMNKSFRNFILTEVVDEDTSEMANTIKQQGSWSKIKMPFFIVIIGILFFIFITQKEMFNSIILFAGAFITGITTISKIATIVPSKDK